MNNIRAFGSFCFFFSGSFLMFWPYALVLSLFALGVPLLVAWQGDVLNHAAFLINGLDAPAQDPTLTFIIPGAMLFLLPIMLCFGSGSLIECHKHFYSLLVDSFATPYGFLGWALTLAIVAGFTFWALYCAKSVLGLSWASALKNLTALVAIVAFFGLTF